MFTASRRCITILPGSLLVHIHVEIDVSAAVLVLRPDRFLEGLRAAVALLGFADVQCEEERLEELLPWSGNV